VKGAQQPKRVLFVNPSLFAIGGMQAWLDRLMPDLEGFGWDVWLGLPTGRFNDAKAYLSLHPWEKTVLFENPTGSRLGRERAVILALGSLRPAIVVSSHIPAIFEAVERMRWDRATAPKAVASLHSLAPAMLEDVRTFASAVDALVGPNRLMPAVATALGVIEPERAFYAPGTAEFLARIEAGQVEEELRIVYAGRFEEQQKRISDIPKVLAALDRLAVRWRMDVAGIGPDEGILREGLAAWEARGAVQFHGGLPPDVLQRELLLPGRVLLLTSHWEQGPAIGWEALGRGMLIVSSRFVGSGLEAALEDGVTGLLFDIGDVEAAASALAALEPRRVRLQMAVGSLERGRVRYGRAVGARAWSEILERVLEMSPRTAPSKPTRAREAGRLDRWLGAEGAEAARKMLGRRVMATGPGDEWPCAVSQGMPAGEFFDLVSRIDRGSRPLSPRPGETAAVAS